MLFAESMRYRPLLLALAIFALQHETSADQGIIDLFLNNPALDSSPGRAAQNIVYYGVYFIGTPSKRFLGCFDTGSGDVWLPASSCNTDICHSHDQYNPQSSSTGQAYSASDSSNTISITYGTGQVVASRVSDTMSFGGIVLPTQVFGAASQLSPDFSSLSCDGLVGLAFPAMSHFNYNPPFINAGADNLLQTNIFGIYLNPAPNVEPAGSLSIGQIEPDKFTGAMTQLPITRQVYWTVSLSSYALGSRNFAPSVNTAILDCGTTAIFLPQADANAINSAIPTSTYWAAQDIYNVTCDYTRLPDLTFTLGGSQFALPPSLYVQQLTNTAGSALGICASAIIGGQSRVILGTNFLRAWYTEYTWATSSTQATVGLAQAVGVTSTSSTATNGRRLNYHHEPKFDINVLHKRHFDSFDQPRWGWKAPSRRDHNYDSHGARLS